MFSLIGNCYGWLKTRREPTRKLTLVSIGLDDAGKTTTLASLQGEPPDGITPTLGFANAELTLNRFQVTIYDLGGGSRVRSIWKNYYAEIFGLIFVVDSCNKDRLTDVRDVLAEVTCHPYVSGKPLLLLANKQDRADAASTEEIKYEINLDELAEKNGFVYHMVGCSAVKGYGKGIDKSIQQGVHWLLAAIQKDMANLAPRVERESAIQREEDEKERLLKRAEAKRLREERELREKEAGIYEEDPADEDDDDVAMENPFMPIKDHIKAVESKSGQRDGKKATSSKITKKKKEKGYQPSGIPSIAVQPASPEQPTSDRDRNSPEEMDDVVQVTVHRKISNEDNEMATQSNGYHIAHANDENEGDQLKNQLRKQQKIIDDEEDEPVKVKPKKKRKKKRRSNKTAPLSDPEDQLQEHELTASHSARSLPPLRSIGRHSHTSDLPGMEPLPFQTRTALPAWTSPRPNSEDNDVLM